MRRANVSLRTQNAVYPTRYIGQGAAQITHLSMSTHLQRLTAASTSQTHVTKLLVKLIFFSFVAEAKRKLSLRRPAPELQSVEALCRRCGLRGFAKQGGEVCNLEPCTKSTFKAVAY